MKVRRSTSVNVSCCRPNPGCFLLRRPEDHILLLVPVFAASPLHRRPSLRKNDRLGTASDEVLRPRLCLVLMLVLEGPDLHGERPHLLSENFDLRLESPTPRTTRLGWRRLATVARVIDGVRSNGRGVRGVQITSARLLDEVFGEWRVLGLGELVFVVP